MAAIAKSTIAVLLVVSAALLLAPTATARSLSQAKPPSYASVGAALTGNADTLSTLLAAVKAAGINIPADAKWTIFAPVNSAFSDANIKAKAGLTAAQLLEPANKDALVKVLSYHIVPSGAVTSSQLKDGQVVDTSLANGKLTVDLKGDSVKIKSPGSTATVVTPDIKAGGSVIHVVDKVLLPAALVKKEEKKEASG